MFLDSGLQAAFAGERKLRKVDTICWNKLDSPLNRRRMVLVGIGTEFGSKRGSAGGSFFYRTCQDRPDRSPLAAALLAFHKSQKKVGGCEKEQVQKAYEVLADLLKDKNYFVISLCEDGLLEQAGLKENRILTPAKEGEEETDSGVYPTDSWETYTKWLQGTLNRNLVILELGVGMELPQLIRFPFEKVAYFNQKSCLYRVHSHLYQMTEEIKERGYSVPMHPVTLLLEEK